MAQERAESVQLALDAALAERTARAKQYGHEKMYLRSLASQVPQHYTVSHEYDPQYLRSPRRGSGYLYALAGGDSVNSNPNHNLRYRSSYLALS